MRGMAAVPNCVIAAALCFAFLMPVSAANAAEPVSAMLVAESVAPGETLEFMQAENGVRECRATDTDQAFFCGRVATVWLSESPIPPFRFIGTSFNLSRNEVQATFDNQTSGSLFLSQAHYATAAVYNDFQINDLFGTGNIVDAQFAIKYSWEGRTGGTLSYESRIILSVEVEDITGDPSNPIGIGSFDLVSRDRQGDQGVTDVAFGAAVYDRNDDTASFSLKLRSGRTYRIWFKAEAYGTNVPFSTVSNMRGRWSELSVTVVQDDTELLFQLQDDLKQHDMDIKAQLAKQQAQLRKIIYLLKDDDDDDDDDRRRRRRK